MNELTKKILEITSAGIDLTFSYQQLHESLSVEFSVHPLLGTDNHRHSLVRVISKQEIADERVEDVVSYTLDNGFAEVLARVEACRKKQLTELNYVSGEAPVIEQAPRFLRGPAE